MRIGGVAGGIVGLIVLRMVYVKWIRPACCKPKKLKESDEPRSRGRRSPEKKDQSKKKKKTPSISKKKDQNGDIPPLSGKLPLTENVNYIPTLFSSLLFMLLLLFDYSERIYALHLT